MWLFTLRLCNAYGLVLDDRCQWSLSEVDYKQSDSFRVSESDSQVVTDILTSPPAIYSYAVFCCYDLGLWSPCCVSVCLWCTFHHLALSRTAESSVWYDGLISSAERCLNLYWKPLQFCVHDSAYFPMWWQSRCLLRLGRLYKWLERSWQRSF